MIEEKQLHKNVDEGLAYAKTIGATNTEIVISQTVEDLTRFANNSIHQSVSLTDSLVHVRVVVGKKIGVVRTNVFSGEGVRWAIKTAKELSAFQNDDPHFVDLPHKAAYKKHDAVYEKAVHLGPKGRAKAIKVVIDASQKKKLSASGWFVESDRISIVANSNGVWGYQASKSATFSTIITGADGSGYGSHSAKGGKDIDTAYVSKQAIGKAVQGKLLDIEPGEYEVILEPPAVAELLDFFSWVGPNARMYHEDASFYHGNIDKKLLHESLTILDDPGHEMGYPIGFDWEGFPKTAQTLVQNGVLKSVAYDSYHAAKYKSPNTGNALLAPNTFGPVPTHIVIAPGDKSLSTMIKSIKKGILVTRFWYTRIIHHKKVLLTGMTRDGTFLIENGKIKGRVRNMRYTESVLEALRDIRGIGDTQQLVGSDEGSPTLVPALHLGKFRFSGVTKHG